MTQQPVWDLADALPWWVLGVSTVVSLAGLALVAVRHRSAGAPGTPAREDQPLTD